uniref:Uncharacterized protein n=1 Tax=Ixodes ricinus TaxID=34613 RepID=A0A147BF43_IXORI
MSQFAKKGGLSHLYTLVGSAWWGPALSRGLGGQHGDGGCPALRGRPRPLPGHSEQSAEEALPLLGGVSRGVRRPLHRVGGRLPAHRAGRRGLERDRLQGGAAVGRPACCQLTMPLSREPALPRRTGRAAVCWSWRSSSELESADRLRHGDCARGPSPVPSMSARPESLWSQGLRRGCCFSSSPSMRRFSISSISKMASRRSSTNLQRSCSLRAFSVISARSSTLWLRLMPCG